MAKSSWDIIDLTAHEDWDQTKYLTQNHVALNSLTLVK